MKQWARDIVATLLITSVIVLFFLPLFWPTQQLLVTPDFGKSDSWHFSFATKYALWESLHEGKLPLWSDKIGDGFPLFAEGQIGTFFLPNLILFTFVGDPVLAYNLSLVVTVLILAWGTYAWLRLLKLSPVPSIFGSLTFTLSGIVILQLPHITLLQGFSILPWFMALTQKIFEKPTRRVIGIAAFVLSQQILAGFPQATFLTLLLAGSFALWRVMNTRGAGRLLSFACAVLLGFGLSAIQLIPSYEFLQQTTLPKGLPPEIASYFSFPLKHLASFLNPFALGDPAIGSYPHFAQMNGSIFWENTGYVGLLPLILLPLAIRFRSRLTSYCLIVLLSSFLLMWGSGSPIYLIYSFWPFNLFRVPSRFLWIFVFALVTIASMGLQSLFHMTRKKVNVRFSFFLIALHIFTLFSLWKNYHLLVPAKSWMRDPKLLKVLPDQAKIYSIGNEQAHNATFLSSGWIDPTPYEALRTTLAADSNILWRVASHNVYAGRTLRRSDIADNLLTSQIHITNNIATISAIAQKMLDLFSVTHIISTVALSVEGNPQKPIIFDQSSPDGTVKITLSTNPTASSRAYLATNVVLVRSVEDAQTNLISENFIAGKSALVEEPMALTDSQGVGKAKIVRSDDSRVTVDVTSEDKGLLVLTDTYYPGWVAFVDTKPAPILPVNIRYRGILVNNGRHTIEFLYQPKSFAVGANISGFFLIVLVALVVFPGPVVTPGTRQKVYWRAPHRGSSRGTSGLGRG